MEKPQALKKKNEIKNEKKVLLAKYKTKLKLILKNLSTISEKSDKI